jgi:hypothetical protein
MEMFEKIENCIKKSETMLHLVSSFQMIENYEKNPEKDNSQLIILKYLLKEQCKTLNIEYSDLNDYINKLN